MLPVEQRPSRSALLSSHALQERRAAMEKVGARQAALMPRLEALQVGHMAAFKAEKAR